MLLPVVLAVGLLAGSLLCSGSATSIGAWRGAVEQSTVESSKLLDVPYISQGHSHRCFEASLDMVLRYWGKDVSLQDIGKASGHGSNAGDSFFDLFLGWVGPYLSRWHDLDCNHDILAWDFSRYRAEIDRGMPVIATTFGLPGHTIVVVGYSVEAGHRFLYVHDPSGYLTNLKWRTGAVKYARVPWSQFAGFYWTELAIGPS